MFIKICGITNITDALLATKLGASALGFVFAPSKRQIKPNEAAKIISQLPQDIERVGVFVNETKENIFKIAELCGLTIIQLHGDESPQMCREIGEYYKVIKAIKIKKKDQIKTNQEYPVWKILLDTYSPQVEGGSGQTFDWDILNEFDLDNVIVAGGLNPTNISDLLTQHNPFGIDLSSGVELSPGKKDKEKLELFFKQIEI